jgi:hypothetical protein
MTSLVLGDLILESLTPSVNPPLEKNHKDQYSTNATKAHFIQGLWAYRSSDWAQAIYGSI